ncbi:OsmC family protein [Geodermatophilus sp. URMC 63]
MDAAQLRELQAPLKQRYRDEPASARAQMSAEADFSDPGITATVQTWSGPVRAGLHPSTDADDATLARLGELTERYCVVAQTLARSPHLTVRRAG